MEEKDGGDIIWERKARREGITSVPSDILETEDNAQIRQTLAEIILIVGISGVPFDWILLLQNLALLLLLTKAFQR